MLKLINNKNINGNFFIENFDEREEKDRVKIYDSDENYLDYLLLEEYDSQSKSNTIIILKCSKISKRLKN